MSDKKPIDSPFLGTVLVWTLLSVLLHGVLIGFGEWQDRNSLVRYTDIDYWVFWEGARAISQGSNPYDEPVFRYSPILALVLVPFVFFSQKSDSVRDFALLGGKFLFSIGDICLAILVYKMMHACIPRNKPVKRFFAHLLIFCNPYLAQISTRGNAEGLIMATVFAWAYSITHLLDMHRYLHSVIAAFGLGFLTHLKIFPVLFGIPIAFYYIRRRRFSLAGVFFLVSAVTFAAFTAGVYFVFGMQGVNGSLLYHLTRIDVRHNFSIYFYPFYLESASEVESAAQSLLISICSFAPQGIAIMAIAYKFCMSIEAWPVAFFLETLVFVAFNKVCTLQVQAMSFILVLLVVSSVDADCHDQSRYFCARVATDACPLDYLAGMVFALLF